MSIVEHLIWFKKASWHVYILPIGIVIYWLLIGFFYPNMYSMVDERQYFAKAYQITKGEIFRDITEPEDAWIEKYPPGQSLMLAVFLKFGHHFIYLLNPIIFSFLVVLFAWYLNQFRLPNYYALFLLFHPTFFLFSRTIMSDIPAVFFLLLGIRLSLHKTNAFFWAGVTFGFSASTRLAFLPLSIFCLLYSIWNKKWNSLLFGKMAIGFFIGIIPLIYYIYRSMVVPEFGYTNDLKDLHKNAISFIPYFGYYLLSLNLVYPLLLVVGMVYKYEKQLFYKTLAVLPFLMMPLMPIHPHHSDNTIFSLIFLRQRYFLISVIVFLFGYIMFLQKRFLFKPVRCIPLIAALVLGCIIISILHHNRTEQNDKLKHELYEATSENALIISDDRPEKFFQDFFGKRKVLNVEVFSDVKLLSKKIDAYSLNDIYVIYTENSEDEISTQMLQSVLDHYPSKLVSQIDNFIIYELIL